MLSAMCQLHAPAYLTMPAKSTCLPHVFHAYVCQSEVQKKEENTSLQSVRQNAETICVFYIIYSMYRENTATVSWEWLGMPGEHSVVSTYLDNNTIVLFPSVLQYIVTEI